MGALPSADAETRAFGPYVATRLLSRGGMSVVYAATHRNNGSVVALKTVRVFDEVHLASLRREIATLGRVRHPGVVRILDDGLEDRVPWYAMEMLSGATLDDVRARRFACGAGDALRDALTLARRICTPLAFLHGQGVVHGDLKPQNVFVRAGDRPVLLDFGLASRTEGGEGRAFAEVARRHVGTPSYMAPEQIRGAAVDARADLYALGCVLYELLVGRPPFGSGHEALVRHLRAAPPNPSHAAPWVPRSLDRLVIDLLAKDPRERVGHAGEVAEALERLGAEPEPGAQRARPSRTAPPVPPSTALVDEVVAVIAGARRGQGSLVLVGGETGVGKTRFALEVAQRSGLHAVASTCARRHVFRRTSPELQVFGEVLSAIADRCIAMGGETTERLLGDRAPVLARFSPRIASLVEVSPSPCAFDASFAPLRDTLAAFAREEPLLLLIDDLQWADPLSIAFLASLPPEWLRDTPIAIVGTYRSEEIGHELRALLDAPATRRIALARSHPQPARGLVLGDPPCLDGDAR